jgi:hypothetical protein
MQEVLPPHVQQALDEAPAEAWAVNLAQQAVAWKAARVSRRSVDHADVLVVRRPARRLVGRAMLHATDRQALGR